MKGGRFNNSFRGGRGGRGGRGYDDRGFHVSGRGGDGGGYSSGYGGRSFVARVIADPKLLRSPRDASFYFQEFINCEDPMDLLKSVLADGMER